MNRLYAVKTRFSFTGTFYVNAGNKEEAQELVEKQCGTVMGEIHSTLPDEDLYWHFPIHPEKKIVRVKLNKTFDVAM